VRWVKRLLRTRPREVAGDVHFPNGMVITPDDRKLIIY
jgi:hypothetical protein